MSIDSRAKSTTTRSSVRRADDHPVRTSVSQSVAIADASRNGLQGHRTLDEGRGQVAGELAVRALRKGKLVDGVKIGVTFTFAKQNDVQFLRTVVDNIQHTPLLQQYLFAIATTVAQKDATANALIICGSSEYFVQRVILLTRSKFLGRVE